VRRARKDTPVRIYKTLSAHFGPQHWWPGDSAFEVVVGAILTQNTAWSNVEKAIANLKREKLLSLEGIDGLSQKRLARLVRPSGYFNQKAEKLKACVRFLKKKCGNTVTRLRRSDTGTTRRELLTIKGIGPETADSILLYALNKPVFVVDAYTKRICARHALVPRDATYDEVQAYFTQRLPEDAALFNEYHALLVMTGKHFCRKRKPECKKCPLIVLK
jgi:endonuclease-3 related protein